MIDAGLSHRARFVVATALLALVLAATFIASRGPSARDESAPSEVFSSGRARPVLDRLVGDGIPHPIGSVHHDVVRDRVIAEFRALGYAPIVERDLACAPTGSCAWVENILATLPGREAGGTVILNAHYDSVPAGPGAGDDATGVAAIIEVARAMHALPPPRHPVLFLVDDGEEAGLLGAEAFVRRHRIADYAAVLVLEARGSSGRTLMFETSQDNREIIDAYARAVPRPSTSSVYFSVYQRLPNDTNFTTFKRAGMKGMAAAFIDDPAQYHTPQNRLEKVPDATLQHMGDTALAVARELADRGLGAEKGNASYFDLFTLAVIRWPETINAPAALLALLALGSLTALQVRARRFSGRAFAWSLAFGLLPLAVAGLAGFGVSSLAALRLDRTLWPASGGFLVLAAWACGCGAVALCASLARGRIGSAASWNGVWIGIAILGIGTAALLPGAAYLFAIPALMAALIGGASWIRTRVVDSPLAVVVPLVAAATLIFPLALELFGGLGAGILPGIAILVSVALMPLLPMLVELVRPLRLAIASLAVALVALSAVFVMPVHSPDVPRPLSLVYQMDRGAAKARWIAESKRDALPAKLKGAASWREEIVPALAIGRADRPTLRTTADAPIVTLAFPEAHVVAVEPRGKRSLLRVELRSPRGAPVMRLRFGASFDPRLVSIGTANVDGPSRTTGVVAIHTVPPEGIVVGIEIDSTAEGSEFVVEDETAGLPAGGEPLQAARGADSVPINRGDRTLLSAIGRVALHAGTPG